MHRAHAVTVTAACHMTVESTTGVAAGVGWCDSAWERWCTAAHHPLTRSYGGTIGTVGKRGKAKRVVPGVPRRVRLGSPST
jgi:hypothetical protein